MTFNSTFTGMPRMQKLFEEVIGDGKCVESSVSRGRKDLSETRNEDCHHGSGEEDGDLKIDTN